MLTDKSNLEQSTITMSMPTTSENKENVRVTSSLNTQAQVVLSLVRESRENSFDQAGMEPLDYRQDWSQEIIDTFGKLQSRLPFEQAFNR